MEQSLAARAPRYLSIGRPFGKLEPWPNQVRLLRDFDLEDDSVAASRLRIKRQIRTP
jgi:hypothetical protein